MKWFQHDTDASNDVFLQETEDRFGDSGYAVYFKILEMYGSDFNTKNFPNKYLSP